MVLDRTAKCECKGCLPDIRRQPLLFSFQSDLNMLHKRSAFTLQSKPSRHRCLAVWVCLLVMPLFLFGPAFGQQKSERKRLGIISAYHEAAPWAKDILLAVRLGLANNPDVVIDPVYMNVSLITDRNYFDRTVDGVFKHFEGNRPDYLLLIGGMGIALRDRIVEEWGDIPIVLVSKTDVYGPPEYYITGDIDACDPSLHRPLAELQGKYNFTYLHYPDLDTATVELMLRMQPTIRKIVVLADASYQNRHVALNIRNFLAERHPDIECEWVVGHRQNVNKLQSYLTNFDPNIGLLLCAWFYGREGTLGVREILSAGIGLIPSVLQPVFTVREPYLKDGAIAGYFPDYNQIHRTVANMIDTMLDGASMRSIPFVSGKDLHSFPIVDYAQLKPLNIPVSLCPPDTRFINKPPTFWQHYKWQIFCIGFIFIAGCIVAILSLAFQRRRIAYLKQHQNLINNMPIGYTQAYVIFSKTGKVCDIQYHSGNDSFLTLLKENSMPDKPDKLFPAEYISGFVQTMLETQRPVNFTFYFKQSDSYHEFRLYFPEKQNYTDNSKINIELFCIDVTTRSLAENNLRQLTNKLDLTLSLAHIIPWRWNLYEHRIYCEAQRILKNIDVKAQYSKKDAAYIINEADYIERIHPDDADRIRAIYVDLYEGREQYAKTEFRLLSSKENAHSYWLEINATVTEYDNQHHPAVISGSLLLITERKKQEKALIEAREKAMESDRMKSVFLANMSHEIRTPLNAIVGFSNLIGRTEDEEKKRKFMDIIKTNNQLLLQLISDVLDLAKVEANTLDFYYQDVDLNDLLHTIEKSVGLRIRETVKLNCLPGMEQCHIQTEPNRLSQVLINLITNANKFTMQGSIDFGYTLKEDELYFFVKDTGLGISKENQTKLFQRFSKLNNFAQGTGLGLSISKGIIEKMGGHIGMESEGEGLGSTFWFTIPYLPLKQEGILNEGRTPIASIKKKDITILIAEDNESNYLLFQSILEPNYKLLHAWDGEEAVAMYKEHNPQLILMDINMPKMDGYEATHEIRKLSETVPIIAVTAYAFASDQKRIRENGFNSFVPKPIDAETLTTELKSMLNKSFILL